MPSSDGYGGRGGFQADGHGNGFLPSPSLTSPGKDGSRTRSALNNSTRPVTIKQIITSESTPQDVSPSINGIAVTEITLVACIQNIEPLSTVRNFILEDGTGVVQAKQYNPPEDGSPLQDGMWVRVFGTIRPNQDSKIVVVLSVRPIVEFNEITYHNLAVIEAYLVLTRGPISGRSAPLGHGDSFGQERNPFAASNSSNAISPNDPLASSIMMLSPIQKEIFLHYKSFSSLPNGLSINDVIRHFRSKYDHKEVMRASQFLIEEGYLFVTIDENHARVTQ